MVLVTRTVRMVLDRFSSEGGRALFAGATITASGLKPVTSPVADRETIPLSFLIAPQVIFDRGIALHWIYGIYSRARLIGRAYSLFSRVLDFLQERQRP
jgi:hypothetical protein